MKSVLLILCTVFLTKSFKSNVPDCGPIKTLKKMKTELIVFFNKIINDNKNNNNNLEKSSI